jgi:hypothetical protein
MRGVRVGVDVFLDGVLGEGVGEPPAGDAGRERHVARGDALGHREQVGDHAVVLAGEPPPGPAEAGDDLVGDHQHVQLVAEAAHGAQPADGRDDEPAGADDRLQDHRRDRLRSLAEDRLTQLGGPARHQLLVAARAAVVEGVRRLRLDEARTWRGA